MKDNDIVCEQGPQNGGAREAVKAVWLQPSSFSLCTFQWTFPAHHKMWELEKTTHYFKVLQSHRNVCRHTDSIIFIMFSIRFKFFGMLEKRWPWQSHSWNEHLLSSNCHWTKTVHVSICEGQVKCSRPACFLNHYFLTVISSFFSKLGFLPEYKHFVLISQSCSINLSPKGTAVVFVSKCIHI